MAMMFTDGSRAYVWTCPYCGWTKASADQREHEKARALHRPECWAMPLSAWRP